MRFPLLHCRSKKKSIVFLDFRLSLEMFSKTGKDGDLSPFLLSREPGIILFYVHQLIIKQLKEFSHWIKEIEHYIKKIEEEHKITPEQVLKITNDAKHLKDKKKISKISST